MKKNNQGENVRWDPIVAKLAENGLKQKLCQGTNQQHKTLKRTFASKKRRSKEDFEVFLKSLFAKDTLKVKYQNPNTWRINDHKKKKADY